MRKNKARRAVIPEPSEDEEYLSLREARWHDSQSEEYVAKIDAQMTRKALKLARKRKQAYIA
jgi:hypothetical protein